MPIAKRPSGSGTSALFSPRGDRSANGRPATVAKWVPRRSLYTVTRPTDETYRRPSSQTNPSGSWSPLITFTGGEPEWATRYPGTPVSARARSGRRPPPTAARGSRTRTRPHWARSGRTGSRAIRVDRAARRRSRPERRTRCPELDCLVADPQPPITTPAASTATVARRRRRLSRTRSRCGCRPGAPSARSRR